MNPGMILALACAIIGGVGCTAGRNFTRPSDDSIALGKTTRAEIVERFGKPTQESTLLKNGQTLKSGIYSYARGAIAGGAHASGITPGRAIGFWYAGDIVVGYDFLSSFEEDHTDFDDSKVAVIKEGKTSREEVLTLLGPPQGRQIFPLVDNQEDAGLVYLYTQFKAPATIYRKVLTVAIAPDGVVRKVTYTQSGAR